MDLSVWFCFFQIDYAQLSIYTEQSAKSMIRNAINDQNGLKKDRINNMQTNANAIQNATSETEPSNYSTKL